MFRFRSLLCCFGLTFFCLSGISAQAACDQTQIISPDSALVSETRPLIKWQPVADAQSYRIELLSRIPEGKILVSIDTTTKETSFSPPQDLTDYKALTRIKITAQCEHTSSPPVEKRFVIDVSTQCKLDNPVVIKHEADLNFSWQKAKSADLYEAAVYSLTDGRLITKKEVTEANLSVATPTEAVTAAIRPRCKNIWGDPIYGVVIVDATQATLIRSAKQRIYTQPTSWPKLLDPITNAKTTVPGASLTDTSAPPEVVKTLNGSQNYLTKWNQHPVTLPWTEEAISLIVKYQQNPLRAARVLALLHAAIYDAVIKSAESVPEKEAHIIAIHSAASAMLSYLYPQEPLGKYGALGRAASQSAALSRNIDNETAVLNWAIGQSVAASAITRALHDKSDLSWDLATRPKAALGTWTATPPMNIYKPAEPRAKDWQPWLLTSGAEIQPPPPIKFDTPEYWTEVKTVLDATNKLTPAQKKIADEWNLGHATVTPPGVWNLKAKELILKYHYSSADAARVFAALNIAMMDAFIACWHAKFTYWTARPVTAIRAKYDENFLPYLITPPFPSYVSGHASVSGAASMVLAAFFPREKAELIRQAEEAALSRLYGGIHFPSDNNQGLLLGQRVGEKVIQRMLAATSAP